MSSVGSEKPALRTIDLAVGYRTRKNQNIVLRELNATVARGELVCLLGPNGVGKSSLLRTVAKIQPPISGVVELDGTDIRQISTIDLARRLGVVLTDRVDVGGLPAYRVVELGRYPHLNWAGTLGGRDHEVVRWAMLAVGVTHLATRDCNTLSDGERQRIMIARALAQEPVVLLLDEPTAFLDVASRVELMGLLRRLAREESLAIVLSTHDLELALRTADTIWLAALDDRFWVGSPEDIILAGHLGAVFESKSVRFHAEDRAFRLLPGTSGSAAVKGEGLAAALAAAVLEREGYAITRNGDATLVVSIGENANWHAIFAGSNQASGQSFADLADCIRAFNRSDMNCGANRA